MGLAFLNNVAEKKVLTHKADTFERLQALIDDADRRYERLFLLSPQLDRKLVSFQANKKSPIYRLFKYKEGFSAALVSFFIEHLNLTDGPILDPFSGTGTTSIVAASKGIPSTGIELLPIGNLIAQSRLEIARGLTSETLERLQYWKEEAPWQRCKQPKPIQTLRITKDAYSKDTETAIAQYLEYIQKESEQAQIILKFALCSILEEVSFTRKDGQYLRWDHRSGRQAGKTSFDKGVIHPFDSAIKGKLSDIIDDAEYREDRDDLFNEAPVFDTDGVHFIDGSCLYEMQKLQSNSFQAVITSPPYCNRYDYTRTYALELALLGVDEKEIVNLRQTMLSCTVENREKDLLGICQNWKKILNYCASHELLSAINAYLSHLKEIGELNNNGIPRMLDGYFKEMACIVFESARVLKKGGYMLMVNDNVRYAGASIPVDAILSDIAQQCGLETVNIMVLPSGKGNSSQQMGMHGRSVLRKCVYVWRKK